MEKEYFIEQILNSTNGITNVVPSADLFSKIEHHISEQKVVPIKTIWIAAASIAALLVINVSMIASKSQSIKMKTEVLSSQLNKSNQLYY